MCKGEKISYDNIYELLRQGLLQQIINSDKYKITPDGRRSLEFCYGTKKGTDLYQNFKGVVTLHIDKQ